MVLMCQWIGFVTSYWSGGSNVDTNVIVSEEPPAGSTRKPEELYGIIERFSQVWRSPHCACLCTVDTALGIQADPRSPSNCAVAHAHTCAARHFSAAVCR